MPSTRTLLGGCLGGWGASLAPDPPDPHPTPLTPTPGGLQVQWFERSAALPPAISEDMHEREVAETAQTDCNLVGCIDSRAHVVKADTYEQVRARSLRGSWCGTPQGSCGAGLRSAWGGRGCWVGGPTVAGVGAGWGGGLRQRPTNPSQLRHQQPTVPASRQLPLGAVWAGGVVPVPTACAASHGPWPCLGQPRLAGRAADGWHGVLCWAATCWLVRCLRRAVYCLCVMCAGQ